LIIDNYLHGAARQVLAYSERVPTSPRIMLAILTFETYLRQVAGMPTVSDSGLKFGETFLRAPPL
jgi:hypothetical protein